MTVEIIKENCIGCGVCVPACPQEALDLVDDMVVVDPDKCDDCGDCIDVCPTDALALESYSKSDEAAKSKKEEKKKVRAKSPDEDYSGVWIMLEQDQCEMADVSWELLGLGRKLADDLNVELSGVLFGHKVKSQSNLAFEYGADKVYLIDASVLKDYRTEPYSRGLSLLVEKYKPEIILIGATAKGRDLAGHVATKVKTGLTADCTELSIDKESRLLMQTRPAFGGNVMATIVCENHRPQMASVRPKVMPMPEKEKGRKGDLVEEKLDIKEKDVATKILEFLPEEEALVNLEQFDIIVAGGKGLGSKENFQYVFDLAEALGGTPGASRAAVEAGWIDAAYQVGQTGATVRPKLYFAIGISGAIQHVVGMKTSDIIVALNSDPDAPIFEIADYGIVGDYQTILPLLTDTFRQKLKS